MLIYINLFKWFMQILILSSLLGFVIVLRSGSIYEAMVLTLIASSLIFIYSIYDMQKRHKRNGYEVLFDNQLSFELKKSLQEVQNSLTVKLKFEKCTTNSGDDEILLFRDQENIESEMSLVLSIRPSYIILKELEKNKTLVKLKLKNKLQVMDFTASLWALKDEIEQNV